MIPKEKFDAWRRKTEPIIDLFERVNADPMQHLTEQQKNNYLMDFFEATDEMLGTDFVKRFKEGK